MSDIGNTKNNQTPKRPASLRDQANAAMRAANGKTKTDSVNKKPVQSSDKPVRKEHPVSDKPVRKERPASKDAINTEKELKTMRSAKKPEPYNARNVGRSKLQAMPKPPKKKLPYFWIIFAAYVILLLVLSTVFLMYTDKSLQRYEDSQSENYMAEYIKEFEQKAHDNSLSTADFTFKDIDLTFVDTNAYITDYIAKLDNIQTFTFEKDPSSYLTESPIYQIFGDGTPIARVSLEARNPHKIFAILTIMDWKVSALSPICSIDVNNLSFTIPEGYSAVINGTYVDSSYAVGGVKEIPEFANISEYVDMPGLVEYKVNNVMKDATVNVVDENGVGVNFIRTDNKITAFYSTNASEMSEERRNNALMMVQTYEDFLTDDLGGGSHGLATIQQYLIKDSFYWNSAIEWATGPDIGFTSAHKFADPKYSDVVIDNYVEYSENCYSVHISFTKNMILTRTGEMSTNEFDSTVYFVFFDNPNRDDDTPHWCIADMIATTN